MLERVKNVMIGTFGAAFIGLLGAPLITRLYTPADMGVFQIFVYMLLIAQIIGTLRYEMALMKIKKSRDYRAFKMRILQICCLISCAFAILSLPLAFYEIIGQQYTILFWLFPVMIFVGGIHNLSITKPLWTQDYLLNSKSKILQASAAVLMSICLSPIGLIGLLLSDLIGRICSIFYVFFQEIKHGFRLNTLFNKKHFRLRWSAYRPYRFYPKRIVPASLLGVLSSLMPILYLAYYFDLSSAGNFALIERFIIMPIGLVTYALSQLFLGDFSYMLRERPQEAKSAFIKISVILFCFAILSSSLIALIIPPLIPFVFGPQWGDAKIFVIMSLPIIFGTILIAPITATLVICQKFNWQLGWDSFRFILFALLFGFMAYHGNVPAHVVILSYGLGLVFSQISFFWLSYRAVCEATNYVDLNE